MQTAFFRVWFSSLALASVSFAQAPAPTPFAGFGSRPAPTPFAGFGSRPSAAATAPDAKDYLGTWEGFLTDGDGSNSGQRRMNINLTITDKAITSGGQGTVGEGTYKISGTGKLRHIDATGTAGQYSGKLYEGIFTVEGNTLKWCAGNPGRGRPSALKTNTGAGHFLMVLTRKN